MKAFLFILLTYIAHIVADESYCDEYSKNQAIIRKDYDTCYVFHHKSRLDFPDAEEFCEKEHGGTLAMPKYDDVNTFLSEVILDNKVLRDADKFWIGLSDQKTEGQFVWEDGWKLHNLIDFNCWGKSEGLNHLFAKDEDCVAMTKQVDDDWKMEITWDDYRCTMPFGMAKKSFICQYEAKF